MKNKKQIEDQTLKYHHALNEELQGRLEGKSFLPYIQGIFTEGLVSIIITNMYQDLDIIKYVVKINSDKIEIAERDKGQETYYQYFFKEEAYFINKERQETKDKRQLISKVDNILKDINLLNARVFEEHLNKEPKHKIPSPQITKSHQINKKKPTLQVSERRRRYQIKRDRVIEHTKIDPFPIQKSWWDIFYEKLKGLVK